MIKAATAGSALGDGAGCGVSASPISAFKRVEVMSMPASGNYFDAQPYRMSIASSLTLLAICGD
ncbi:hypothetical protein [Mesorhizobium sp.]|uniref:hypothetical protein n=1 Tax=Mesorhizobium sp. TaxID=1871066 RepID=UPI000FE6635B|nr:hypothetical protein [Mesorhizobium sp.]RWB84781.1 MAG: hypothetical protein EOQ51_17800 [Mesorhizobium sp.]